MERLDANLVSFTPGPNGLLYVLGTDGNIWTEDPGRQQSGRTLFASGVLKLLSGTGGHTIDVLETNGALWRYTGSGRISLHPDIHDIWYDNHNYMLIAQGRNGSFRRFPA